MTDFRDVTPSNQKNSANPKDIVLFIIEFLRHPMEKIKSLPNWNWSTLIITCLAISMSSGVLTGLIPPNFFRIAGGLFISPIIGFSTSSIGALFLYYYFQVYEKRTCSLRKIFTLIVFANIPFFVFQIASEVIPPITLIGFAFTSLLMAIGLAENFQMEKRRAVRLCAIVFGIVFVLWAWNKIDISRLDKLG